MWRTGLAELRQNPFRQPVFYYSAREIYPFRQIFLAERFGGTAERLLAERSEPATFTPHLRY